MQPREGERSARVCRSSVPAWQAATALHPRALKYAATVFGAPTEETFLCALRGMSQADFDELRLEMNSMGMDNRPEAELA